MSTSVRTTYPGWLCLGSPESVVGKLLMVALAEGVITLNLRVLVIVGQPAQTPLVPFAVAAILAIAIAGRGSAGPLEPLAAVRIWAIIILFFAVLSLVSGVQPLVLCVQFTEPRRALLLGGEVFLSNAEGVQCIFLRP